MNNTSDSSINNDAISGNNTYITTGAKRRILALCGAKSNNTITKLQLQHLHIIDEHTQNNDIYYLHGPIEVELNEDDDDDITNTNFVHGPFYSWFPKFDDVATATTTEEDEENSSREKDKKEVLNESIVKAVHYVLQTIHTKGPFDGIYGFSQGAFIASLVAGIQNDDMLQESILSLQKQQNNYTDVQSSTDNNNLGRSFGGGIMHQIFGRQSAQQNNNVTGDEEQDNSGDIIAASTQVHRGSTSYHIDESFMIDDKKVDETGNSESIVQKHYNPVSSSNKKSRRRNTSLTLETEGDEEEATTLRQSSFRKPRTRSEFEGKRRSTDQEASVVSTQPQQSTRSSERSDLTRSSRPMRRWSSLELVSSEIYNNEGTNRRTSRVERRRGSNTSNQLMRNIFGSLTGTGTGRFGSLTASITGSNFAGLLNDDAVNVAPFKFVILACAAVSKKEGLDLDNLTCTSRYFGNDALFLRTSSLIEVKSIQLIGVDDPLRCQSERVARCFLGGHVLYMPGSGHQITTSSHDKDIITTLKSFVKADGYPAYNTTLMLSEFNAVSKVSSLSLHQSKQIARVQLNDSLFREHSTIVNSLAAQPYDRPFLYNARNINIDATTTYGQALEFITGGQGDLRRLGVKGGDVVAYIAPAGGSSVGALAFLSISAQTTAAPLAPNITEQDCHDACEQFNARHMILFENVDSPDAERAFKRYSEEGRGILHYAKFGPDEKPGQFKYTSKAVENYTSRAPLRNRHNNTALLLRTSGTTSRPKAVPLKQSSIVRNGAVISHSMQLNKHDVCYSVMPLFHIGGISASILCTMASGGSVCCDNEPYDASRMIEALSQSTPQPTWYSSVPTIHNNTVAFMKDANDPKYSRFGINADGIWNEGHSLRMIRSGAASLHISDAQALSKAYGDIPIYPTYSMSEQMPISQPPAGKLDTIQDKPGSVGVPVATDVVVVNPATLQPQPYGFEGEISIRANSLVMEEYLDNPEATTKSFFYLTMQDDGNEESTLSDCRYFLTGDLGVLSRDGFLTLNGRSKELIKKAGEQISPPEVEEVLTRHPWIKRAVVVSVDSKLYGEEVGVALALTNMALTEVQSDLNSVKKEMRRFMKQQELAPYKWPTRWKLVSDAEYNALPRTNTRKLKRRESSTYLGFIETDDNAFKDSGEEEALRIANKVDQKALIDWDVITGFRAILACYVMFMHLGSNESWGKVSLLRGWPWHVHCFFTLGGFSLSSPMNPIIKKKFAYFKKRIKHIYPMYALSLIFGLVNLLVVCRPSTFDPNFHWNGQPTDVYQPDGTLSPLFCEGTPAFKQSYWGSLVSTLAIYVFGLAVTPAWPMNWWMGYYLWFMSMYFQCLVCFPLMYNALMKRTRKRPGFLLRIMIALQVLNFLVVYSAFVVMREGEGYNSPSEIEGEQSNAVTDGMPYNVAVLSFYLFGPFWIMYFVIGGVLAFIYDAIKPAEKHTAKIWGLIADCCSLIMLGISISIICQGEDNMFLRPQHANQYDTDTSSIIRLWDNVGGRISCPLTTIWIFSLSTGRGLTAYILRSSLLSKTVGLNSYGCFLFHQMVAQWYYAATRKGHFWYWWRYRKSFYWFSPQPCPIEWYEYFTVVAIVVLFSQFVQHTMMPVARRMLSSVVDRFAPTMDDEEEEINTCLTIFGIIENVTGIEPELDSTLDEVGLASVGIPVIVGMVNRAFNTKQEPLAVTQQDLVGARTIGEIIAAVDNARDRMHHDGV